MKLIIFLCVVAFAAVCFAEAEPLPDNTADESEGFDMRMLTGRLTAMMRRVYDKSDRYDVASSVLRTVVEHLFSVFYRG
ncbi:unnamed protein product [Larinioides sclopetarius]|uniref:Uncharacterized protein n=1 Tax=Larinioides sclopetarius TaxID=280406 RepID=A0AAV2A5N2_9ARAC